MKNNKKEDVVLHLVNDRSEIYQIRFRKQILEMKNANKSVSGTSFIWNDDYSSYVQICVRVL